MTAWRVVGLLGAAAWLFMCRPIGQGDGNAAPPPDAAAASDAPPPREAAAKPAERIAARQCAPMRREVERQLAVAQRCKSDGECEAITFDYAFRPCGISVRTGAALTKVTADAKLYRERCNPVIRPVRCPHTPRPVCQRGRCALAPPA